MEEGIELGSILSGMTISLPEIRTYEEFMSLLDSGRPFLVKFNERKYEPSVGIGPAVASLAEKLAGRLDLYKLFYEVNPKPWAQFKISGIPCLMFFQDGRELYRVSHLGLDGSLEQLVGGYFGIDL